MGLKPSSITKVEIDIADSNLRVFLIKFQKNRSFRNFPRLQCEWQLQPSDSAMSKDGYVCNYPHREVSYNSRHSADAANRHEYDRLPIRLNLGIF